MIRRRTLVLFWRRHPDSKEPLTAWFNVVSEVRWETPAEAASSFPYVSVLPARRLVFNIGGNKYRLLVKVNYRFKKVFIRFIGTHAEYDEIDAEVI